MWRLTQELAPHRVLTLEVFDSPGVRARTIRIVADGAVQIDDKVIMSALTAPLQKRAFKVPTQFMEDIRAVVKEVADASGVTVEEMQGKSRHFRVSNARKVAIFVAMHRLGITYGDLGKFFNRSWEVMRNHIADVTEQCRAANPDPHGTVETSEAF